MKCVTPISLVVDEFQKNFLCNCFSTQIVVNKFFNEESSCCVPLCMTSNFYVLSEPSYHYEYSDKIESHTIMHSSIQTVYELKTS